MPGEHTHIYNTHLNLIFYTTPMAQDHELCKEKALAGSQAAHMQSLAHEMEVWGTWPAAQMQSSASPFLWVADNGAWAAQMQSPCCGCLKAVLQHRQWCAGHNTVRGPPLQTRVVAAYGTVSQLANMMV